MKTRILSAFSILLFVTACNSTFEVGIEHSPSGTLDLLATPTEIPISPATIVPTAVPSTTATLAISKPPVPQKTITESTQNMVKIFLIAVNDNGQTGIPVGCGDSAVPVLVEIAPTQVVLKAALESLLSVKEQYYGQSGLYNALYQSDLQVENVTIDNSGKASVYLTGTLKMGGECDTPRVHAQFEQTALQFPTVKTVIIYINGILLSDVVSLS